MNELFPARNGDVAYMCPSLENDGLAAWTFGVGERADSFRTLVIEPSKEFVELPHPQSLHEPFSIHAHIRGDVLG